MRISDFHDWHIVGSASAVSRVAKLVSAALHPREAVLYDGIIEGENRSGFVFSAWPNNMMRRLPGLMTPMQVADELHLRSRTARRLRPGSLRGQKPGWQIGKIMSPNDIAVVAWAVWL